MKENIKVHKLIDKLAKSAILLTGLVISPLALANGSFDGHNVNVKFEVWESNTEDIGGKEVEVPVFSNVLSVTNEQNVAASDTNYPDAERFFVFSEAIDHFDWDVDFHQNMIEMTYVSIYEQDHDHQYMYTSTKGFHFQDSEGILSDIIDVKVMDTQFAPFGFDPSLISFDKDNIYVNLNGSMCHIAGMASMPNCANIESPTGFENRITLHVTFADSGMVDNAKLDALFDALEAQYPEYFPSQMSGMVAGYYARYYPGTNIYLGVKDNALFAHGAQFGGLLDAGSVDVWFEAFHIHDSSDTECPDGQHMMPDGMCMNNSAM
jgi:hypothetical protein